jgi:peptidoglycan biosynthesis protein MviN/MurJ (putative lipid II flippase)
VLFRSAFIVFCIIAFESLLAFFLKDYLGVSYVYPIIGFAGGFGVFIVCAILYAMGYKSRVRLKKHATYILTTAVLFAIGVILVSMIAVFLKAELNDPAQLLSYVLFPVLYLLNMLIFVGFYYMLSKKEAANNR